MRFPPTLRSPRALALAIPLALILAACSSAGGGTSARSSQPSASQGASAPVASGAAPCETLPAPSALGAWSPPSTAPAVIPLIVSSQRTCGANRVVFSILDPQNTPIAAPDRSATIAFYDIGADPSKAVATKDGTFIWAIEGQRGVYVTAMDFPHAGLWGAEVTTAAPGSPSTSVRITFDVVPTGYALRVGAKAPASVTPTAASVGGDLSRLSTDPKPEPRFYQASVSDVVGKKPFALIFATPKFCTSGQCGPTLDRVKPFVDQYPSVTFINVEPYKLAYRDGQLQPVLDASNQLQPVASVNEWGIVSEPWIFVVDRTGTITASFEGVVGTDELKAALDAVK
jgi:hypothetical protein